MEGVTLIRTAARGLTVVVFMAYFAILTSEAIWTSGVFSHMDPSYLLILVLTAGVSVIHLRKSQEDVSGNRDGAGAGGNSGPESREG